MACHVRVGGAFEIEDGAEQDLDEKAAQGNNDCSLRLSGVVAALSLLLNFSLGLRTQT